MTHADLIQYYGNATKAAAALGVSSPAVSVWRTRGIPIGRQALIQIQTRGRLRADRPETVPQSTPAQG